MTFAKPKADAASALETVRQFLARLADQPDLALPEVFRRVSEMACETLQVERAGIWLFVNGDRVLRCVNLFEQTRRRHSKGACLALSECPRFLKALASAPLVSCENARTDPRVAELLALYLAPLDIASALFVPALRDGRASGALFFERIGSPREWSEAERAAGLEIADFVVERMKSAEGALRTGPRAHFLSGPPAVPPTVQLTHDLKNLLIEIEVLARTQGPTGAAERLQRIAEAAARGGAALRKLTDSQVETAEHETLPESADDDTDEHLALATATS